MEEKAKDVKFFMCYEWNVEALRCQLNDL